EHAVVALGFGALVIGRITSRSREDGTAVFAGWLDLELGLLVLCAAHALLQLDGGTQSALYPIMYVLAALTGAVAEPRVGRLLWLAAVGFEAALRVALESRRELRPLLEHGALLAAFGLLHRVFTYNELRRVRSDSSRALDEERVRMRDDARMFRLVATPSEAPAGDEERMARSSVQEVHQSLFFTLDLMKRTLGLHSCVLLLADEAGEQLRIVELTTDSDDIAEGPFAPSVGAVGAAIARGVCMNLEHLRRGYAGICYYRKPAAVAAFIALPIREGGVVRGALCADRVEDRPFTPAEEELLRGSVAHLLRGIENERVFMQLERQKREHAVLRRAAQALGAALSEQAVLDAALVAASEIAPYDFAAVTQYDPDSRTHCVRKAVGEGAAELANLSFRDNTSLTAMAVKNRHYLPYRGEFDPGSQVVYTRKASLDGMQSLLILPLLVREHAIGTLALAAKRAEAFGPQVRPTLTALASQLAVALSNAESVRRLEALATTDGLTGCFNKRYFSEQLKAKLSAAERFERKLSLVITDIDHFKLVNDTYGHATGDVVIKELGEILNRLKRETDVVARFGGEEFCVLCEETDTAGALQLAERVRQEVERTSFETEVGKLQVTCSFGVATFPEHAGTRERLFESADRALYKAKHGGRNRVEAG
ncbi:MAG TPA: diguanylate cyclase, partial [Polyangiales bacterium]|nr:diguanylate cyclase [Polyangiales bacterium]